MQSNVPYSGVPGDGNTPHNWSAEAFDWAVKNGYLRGSSADKPDYRLNDPVTREELVVLLWRINCYRIVDYV